jgi:dihydrofolate reductase
MKKRINNKKSSQKRAMKLLSLVSIDGYCSLTNGNMGWAFKGENNLIERYGLSPFFDSVGIVLMNRTQYLIMRTQKHPWPISDKLCYVLTGQGALIPLDYGLPRVNLLTVDDKCGKSGLDYVRELQQMPGQGDIWVMGDNRLTAVLLKNDLIEEINVLRLPVILGDGLSFLGGSPAMSQWELGETKKYPNGTIFSRYRRASVAAVAAVPSASPAALAV